MTGYRETQFECTHGDERPPVRIPFPQNRKRSARDAESRSWVTPAWIPSDAEPAAVADYPRLLTVFRRQWTEHAGLKRAMFARSHALIVCPTCGRTERLNGVDLEMLNMWSQITNDPTVPLTATRGMVEQFHKSVGQVV